MRSQERPESRDAGLGSQEKLVPLIRNSVERGEAGHSIAIKRNENMNKKGNKDKLVPLRGKGLGWECWVHSGNAPLGRLGSKVGRVGMNAPLGRLGSRVGSV